MPRSSFLVEARRPACEPAEEIANGSAGTLESLAHKIPVVVRLPLFVAMMIFFAAVASTQTAIGVMSRQQERQAETLGHVYLDGLSAAVLPHVRAGNDAGVRSVLEEALEFHEGIVDRRLLFIGNDGRIRAEVLRSGENGRTALPPEIGLAETGTLPMSAGGGMWIWRGLDAGGEKVGTVAADLDLSAFQESPRQLRWYLLVFDLVFSLVCAAIGFFMVRRLQQPITLLARRLYDAAFGSPRPIAEDEMPQGDRQAARMFHAFNAMAHASQEREALLTHLADREREAVLGRLTATIAHEVRNPLGGMRTALGTLKHFGDRAETREEAVDFLERGVSALEEVVNATLANHRTRATWRPLSHRDFDDLRLLVEADGRSRDVSIMMELNLPDEVAVAALEVRQVLLNLLLNAVQASSKGGIVKLSARLVDRQLMIEVEDHGGGLEPQMARALEAGDASSQAPGLGVGVVVRLVERLDGRVSVQSRQGSGTRITLHLPLQPREAGQ
ncbi:HAMP domain-containing sensor histidine kinase [Mesorhizobium sp. CAU 1741]|uniref:HAMP domain-containing sensor histidine kinase n=1 Tax=Mesorhizobium sp. CAU 1741 TaxID=3140366 RepID=UPI00325BEBEE